MCVLGPLRTYRQEKGSLHLEVEGAHLTIRALAPDLVQVRLCPAGTQPPPSFAVVKTDWPEVPVRLEETPAALRLSTGRLTVEVARDPVRLRFLDPEGQVVAADHPEGGLAWEPGRVRWVQVAPADAHYYGFGQKVGPLDKRGQAMTMWATDEPLHTPGTDPLYQSIPFFLALREGRAFGLFVDSPARVRYDMAKTHPDRYEIVAEQDVLDAYFFAGPDPREVIARYTELTGRMPLPPKWALGYQQSRYSYYPEARVREIAREMRRRQIPCDVIYLDIDYMRGYRVFTWDPERFPDPAGLIRDLREQGFKVVTIVDPGVKVDAQYPVFQEGVAQGHFICYPDGELFIGTVWPGRTAFPDFTREATRRWWGDLHKEALLDKGVAGIWNDMNEPSCFARNTLPDEVLQGEDGARVPHARVHNVYGLTMCQATYEGLRRHRPDQRPFVLTRSGYAGIQRYAAVWMGDNHSWWEHLWMAMPMCMGMGLSGVPFVGTDVGGFSGDADGELLVRWTQLGVFTPFFRNHSSVNTRDQEPWAFGPEVEERVREAIRLRYRLLPFLYNEFYRASATGLPIMRPLFLEYPDDPETYRLSDQFLVGRDLLVAPVYQAGAVRRLVYLPRGTWVDFWTGKRYEGPAHIIAPAPLDRIPVYVRAGAIIPMGPVQNYVGEVPEKELTLAVYAGADGELELYEDDGLTMAYQQGEFALTRVVLEHGGDGGRTVTLRVGEPAGRYRPPREAVVVRLYLPVPAQQVEVDGRPVAFTRDEDGAAVVRVPTPGARGFVLTARM
ncbi:MAG: DUF4968 domain-containing protein [Firmicutes bacterium]|nr:DUF4968 domain-containing protein [Bacillota bacterium]